MTALLMNNTTPPLRLILTTRCQGHCPFCHSEGYNAQGDMPQELVWLCASLLNDLDIPSISLTGGEPTLRDDLPDLIQGISQIAPSKQINLTTNGAKLLELSKRMGKGIGEVNLSITSLDSSKNCEFQGIDPGNALLGLKAFPASKKKLNVLVGHHNINDLPDLIEYCIENLLSIDLFFELKAYSREDILLQRTAMKKIEEYGSVSIELKTTPTILIKPHKKSAIRVKHPVLSSLIKRDICLSCTYIQECFERICAVRVYPDFSMSLCLNQHFSSIEGDFAQRIKRIYSLVGDNVIFSDFLFAEYK